MAGAGAGGEVGSGPGAGGEEASSAPLFLSETGLYADLALGEEPGPGVVEYRPRFELWSDGAEKRRFLRLPPGEPIDTSDMDAWQFPIGTRAWKEFRSDGVRVETRLLEKVADGDWQMLAFAWNDEDTDAEAAPGGLVDVRGTDHDVPSQVMCRECHNNVPDRLLGVSALQLESSLSELLSNPPSSPLEVPGNPVAQAALGYLHANCGNCHNPHSGVFPTVQLDLWLTVNSLASVEETPTYRTTVGVPFQGVPPAQEISEIRIEPGSPEGSALYQRMNSREPLIQMPPLATDVTDDEGLAEVAGWITSLTPP